MSMFVMSSLLKKPVSYTNLIILLLMYIDFLECVKCDDQYKDKLKGHLEPIFSYGKRHAVEIFDGFPTPKHFFREFVSPEKPVLFKGAAKLSPAFELWNDEYFLSYPESREFHVTVETKKKENRTEPANDVPFSTYLKHYRNKDIYMVNGVPDFLRKDVRVPPCLACQNITNGNMLHNMMWFSNGGTKSVLHNDYAENINCVMKGAKKFYLVDRKYMESLNVTELGYSDVDVERVDLNKYPGLYNMEHFEVTVNPGDCLYVPFLWVHQVTSFDDNIAVNIWWKDNVDVDFDYCNDPDTIMTLKDVTFVGFDKIYEAQYKMIKGRLGHRIRTKGAMTFEDLVNVIEEAGDLVEVGSHLDENMKEQVKKVFKILDKDPTDGIITKKELDGLSKENLEVIRLLFNSVIEMQQQVEAETFPPEKGEWVGNQVPPDWDKLSEEEGSEWDTGDGDHWPAWGYDPKYDVEKVDPKDPVENLNAVQDKKDEL